MVAAPSPPTPPRIEPVASLRVARRAWTDAQGWRGGLDGGHGAAATGTAGGVPARAPGGGTQRMQSLVPGTASRWPAQPASARGRRSDPRSAPPRPHRRLAGARAARQGSPAAASPLRRRASPPLAGALAAARLLRRLPELDPLHRHPAAARAGRRAGGDARGRAGRLLLRLVQRRAPPVGDLPPGGAAPAAGA